MMKYLSSLVLTDQSLACGYLVLVTCWCFSQGVFSRKLRVFIRSHVSEATSPLHGAGGVVFGGYILWVSNGAPRRPSDASMGRLSLTSYNEIVSVPSWPKAQLHKKWLCQFDRSLLRICILTLQMKFLYLLNAGSTTICKYHAPFSHNLHSIFCGHSKPSYITCCRTFISNMLSACS
jgi:hypothetical protein